MGLDLKLYAEDINIDITTDDDEPGDVVEQQVEEQETTEEVEETTEEVEAVVRFGMNINSVIDNLTFLQNHVQRFGVTKQFLHLCNGNGQLNQALGITLPHYESDDLAEDISLDEIPETEVLVEDFKEKIGNAYEAIKKFFKMLWDKLSGFFKAIYAKIVNVGKGLTMVEKRLNGAKGDDEKAKDKKMKGISFSDWKTRRASCQAAYDSLATANVAEGNVDLGPINNILKLAGNELGKEGSKLELKKIKATDAATEGTISSFGWTVQAISGEVSKVKSVLSQLQSSLKKQEASFKKAEADAKKAASDAGGGIKGKFKKQDDETKKTVEGHRLVMTNAGVLASTTTKVLGVFIKTVSMFVKLGMSTPIEGAGSDKK